MRMAGEIAAAGATLIFAAFYIYSGWIVMQDFRVSADKLLDPGTPLWLLAAFFPVGMALMMFHVLVRLASLATGRAEVMGEAQGSREQAS